MVDDDATKAPDDMVDASLPSEAERPSCREEKEKESGRSLGRDPGFG